MAARIVQLINAPPHNMAAGFAAEVRVNDVVAGAEGLALPVVALALVQRGTHQTVEVVVPWGGDFVLAPDVPLPYLGTQSNEDRPVEGFDFDAAALRYYQKSKQA